MATPPPAAEAPHVAAPPPPPPPPPEKQHAEYDGVYWRNSMRDHFRKSSRYWPTGMGGLFMSKGYYKDWAEQAQQKSRFFKKYLGGLESDDELTKLENEVYSAVASARKRGVLDALVEWESYDSLDTIKGKVHKIRRKSLVTRHPDLYTSHAARKKEFQKRKETKSQQKKQGVSGTLPDYSPFLGAVNKFRNIIVEKMFHGGGVPVSPQNPPGS